MKKIFLLIMISFTSALIACQAPDEVAEEITIEKVEIVFDMTELEPGEYPLSAKVTPSGINQLVTFTIVGSIRGVSIINENTLSVTNDALDGTVFKIVAKASADQRFRDVIELKIVNDVDTRIKISTEEQLRSIGSSVETLNQDYILINDIELTRTWTPIGTADFEDDGGSVVKGVYFNGTFNGNGFKISGIEVNSRIYNAGFFAQIGETGVVESVEFEGIVSVSGWSGGVAGINLGIIRNVISKIDVSVLGVSAGSLVAVNKGTIEYSYSLGKVLSETNTNDQPRSTGLVAVNEGIIHEVYGDTDLMETSNYIAFEPTLNTKYMLNTKSMKNIATWLEFDSAIWMLKDGEYPVLRKLIG